MFQYALHFNAQIHRLWPLFVIFSLPPRLPVCPGQLILGIDNFYIHIIMFQYALHFNAFIYYAVFMFCNQHTVHMYTYMYTYVQYAGYKT